MAAHALPISLIPQDDEIRLKRLAKIGILDTPVEETFDKIARLAAELFDSPSGFVTFVDRGRVFFKANISSLQGREVPRTQSFCSLAILEDEVTVIHDTFETPAFLNNPFVTTEGGIRFYVGAPLKTSDGHNLGTVCAIDSVPHEVTSKQLHMLEALSSIVVDELEHRELMKSAIRLQTDLINMAVHDLRQPVTSGLLYLELMSEEQEVLTLQTMSKKVHGLTNVIHEKLNDLLNISRIENGYLELDLEQVDILGMMAEIVSSFELRSKQKNQSITLVSECCIELELDRSRVVEIFENLISNALKYSPFDTEVLILIKKEDHWVVFEIRDQGLGLNEPDMQKLFVKFAKLSSDPTGKERSNGLGLSIVKILVELHRGKVWAMSPGKNMGTSFFVAFPC